MHPVTPPKANKIVIKGGSGNACYEMIKQTESEVTIAPNTLNVWDEIETLTINLQTPTEGIVNEYLIQFTSGSTPTVLNLPEDVKWTTPLKINANKIYQISIVNNLAAYAEFNALNVPQIILNLTQDDIQEIDGGLQIINPDMTSQLPALCAWIIATEHTGEDIDNAVGELGEPMPSEMLNMISGVVYDDGFLIIKLPPEWDSLELVYGFGLRESTMEPSMPQDMYLLIPNDFMSNPIMAVLDLTTEALMISMW